MKRVQYHQVEKEKENEKMIDPRENIHKKTLEWSNYIKCKIEAGIWVILFLFTFHKTEFVKQLLTNSRVTKTFLTVFFVCFGINIAICVFILVLTLVLKFRDYEEYSPLITPFSAVSGLVGFISLIIAVFPVYGFLSLLIVPLLGFGLMMFSHFIPLKGDLNTFCLTLLLGGMSYYQYHYY